MPSTQTGGETVVPATLSRRALTVDRLAGAIDSVLTNATYRDSAQQLAAQIASEDGAGNVLATVERLIP